MATGSDDRATMTTLVPSGSMLVVVVVVHEHRAIVKRAARVVFMRQPAHDLPVVGILRSVPHCQKPVISPPLNALLGVGSMLLADIAPVM